MRIQHQIKRRLQERLVEVKALIAERAGSTRSAIAEELCHRLGFLDGRLRAQSSSCRKALGELARSGHIELPASRCAPRRKARPRRLGAAVAAPVGVPERVEEIEDLRLELVASDEQRRLWNELMIGEHPWGERPLVGRQLRYLIGSAHGYLGAAGFAASALSLRDRDEWIGWDQQQRREHLDRVVSLSRLLIRPGVQCANLASRALAMLVQAFGPDFEARYGYRPWLLESFVDTSRHEGTCYRAANWQRVGASSGRGRQDRSHRSDQTIKDIYVYELDADFRRHLGLGDYQRHPALETGEGLESGNWAHNELGGARLGDARLTRRLVSIVQTKGASPGTPFVDAVAGDRAATAGYYRFIDAPDDSPIDMESILAPHRERTLRRIKGHETVLCVHDTTDLNYATLTACEGLGVIGKNQTTTESRGLRLHSSYALSAGEGVPLGLWNWHCYAPQPKPEHKKKDNRYIELEQKDSVRWVNNLVQCMSRDEQLAGTRVVHVMDREADFFELFDHWRNHPGEDQLVIRAKHNRKVNPGKKKRVARDCGSQAGEGPDEGEDEELDEGIFEAVARQPPGGTVEVDIPRKSARGKKGKQAARPKRDQRRAVLSLRWMKVPIRPSRQGLSSKCAPVDVWLLHVREETPPEDGGKPLEWMLLTTIALESVEDAAQVLDHYAKRWRIEDWHRILKTCCRVEEPAHRDSECLMRLVAINMVIAWRIHLMTLLGREVPELPMEVIFSDLEIEVLGRYCESRRLEKPTNLGEAIVLVARLGGYLARKHDGPPGAEVLWRGSRKLSNWCECAAFTRPPT